MRHCIDDGCLIDDGHCIQCTHAEANAVANCNTDVDEAWLTDRPCLTCLKLMLTKGVKVVHYWRHYEDPACDKWIKWNNAFEQHPLLRVEDELSDRLQEFDSEIRGRAFVCS